MLNYEHEIEKTRDKYINSILGCDYFHDSLLKDISIENFGKDIYFIFSCEREWGEGINLFNCSETADYDYELHFHDCKHFESNLLKDVDHIEYLNGRFKNSAKLKNLSKFTHKKYFHFRMQLTAGICDVIFNKFSIRKIRGTVSIPNYFKFTNHFDLLKKKLSQLDITTILNNARGEDDFEKSEALEYLWTIGNSQTKLLALNALKNAVTYDFTWVSAIFILGEIGTIEDIPCLRKKFDELDKYEPMWALHINDALEKITYRSVKKQTQYLSKKEFSSIIDNIKNIPLDIDIIYMNFSYNEIIRIINTFLIGTISKDEFINFIESIEAIDGIEFEDMELKENIHLLSNYQINDLDLISLCNNFVVNH